VRDEPDIRKKQLQTERGGAGGKRRTGIGYDDGRSGGSGDALPPQDSSLPTAIICDTSLLVRLGLKLKLANHVRVIGDASDGMSCFDLCSRLKPQFLILDANIDGVFSIESCRSINESSPTTKILVWTDSYMASKHFNELMHSSIKGVCLKGSGEQSLLQAINDIKNGLAYCDPRLTKLIESASSEDFADDASEAERLSIGAIAKWCMARGKQDELTLWTKANKSNEGKSGLAVELKNRSISADLLELLPQEVMLTFTCVPIRISNQVVTVAMVEPSDPIALAEIRRLLPNHVVRPISCSKNEFVEFMDEVYLTHVSSKPIEE
jgi:DNA-binding NarL/FixJ family response regulator